MEVELGSLLQGKDTRIDWWRHCWSSHFNVVWTCRHILTFWRGVLLPFSAVILCTSSTLISTYISTTPKANIDIFNIARILHHTKAGCTWDWVATKLFAHETEEAVRIGLFVKLLTGEFHILCYLPYIIRVIESITIKFIWHLARMEKW